MFVFNEIWLYNRLIHQQKDLHPTTILYHTWDSNYHDEKTPDEGETTVQYLAQVQIDTD